MDLIIISKGATTYLKKGLDRMTSVRGPRDDISFAEKRVEKKALQNFQGDCPAV